jgi:choline-glycine betaine transporter
MNNLQSVSLIAALPISIVLILIAASFVRDSRQYLQQNLPPSRPQAAGSLAKELSAVRLTED